MLEWDLFMSETSFQMTEQTVAAAASTETSRRSYSAGIHFWMSYKTTTICVISS
jgi:hypothetical protein